MDTQLNSRALLAACLEILHSGTNNPQCLIKLDIIKGINHSTLHFLGWVRLWHQLWKDNYIKTNVMRYQGFSSIYGYIDWWHFVNKGVKYQANLCHLVWMDIVGCPLQPLLRQLECAFYGGGNNERLWACEVWKTQLPPSWVIGNTLYICMIKVPIFPLVWMSFSSLIWVQDNTFLWCLNC